MTFCVTNENFLNNRGFDEQFEAWGFSSKDQDRHAASGKTSKDRLPNFPVVPRSPLLCLLVNLK